MPEYLSKEEIKQWRSSLERITLEEYAQRLGKVICEEKETHDVIDEMIESNHYTNGAQSFHSKIKNDFSKVSGTIKGINTVLVIEYKFIAERVV